VCRLLAWRRPVSLQDPISKPPAHPGQRRLRAHPVQPHRRNSIAQQPAHPPRMDTQLSGHTLMVTTPNDTPAEFANNPLWLSVQTKPSSIPRIETGQSA